MNYINKNCAPFTIAILAMLFVACTDSSSPPATQQAKMSTPDVVSFKKMALYPESVEYDAQRKSFLVTSLREGVVGAVKDDGTYSVIAQDPNMISAVGIRIDAARDRLFVCNSDPGVSIHTNPKTQLKLAGLAVFQLSTGYLIKYLNLAEGIEGHIFVTISPSPVMAAFMSPIVSQPSFTKLISSITSLCLSITSGLVGTDLT